MILFTSILNILAAVFYFIFGLDFPPLIIILWVLLIKSIICLLNDFIVEEYYTDIYCYLDFFTGIIVLLRDINFLNNIFSAIMIISLLKGTYYLIRERI
ncbi:MAG: hypothetical protein GXN99_00615 [Candidatus Nanohaloarchaeota archaeon]|nr:hypothetical protein [Candidatus Nanohaloarchaeota archaeon]